MGKVYVLITANKIIINSSLDIDNTEKQMFVTNLTKYGIQYNKPTDTDGFTRLQVNFPAGHEEQYPNRDHNMISLKWNNKFFRTCTPHGFVEYEEGVGTRTILWGAKHRNYHCWFMNNNMERLVFAGDNVVMVIDTNPAYNNELRIIAKRRIFRNKVLVKVFF